jgi:hypothetical protein
VGKRALPVRTFRHVLQGLLPRVRVFKGRLSEFVWNRVAITQFTITIEQDTKTTKMNVMPRGLDFIREQSNREEEFRRARRVPQARRKQIPVNETDAEREKRHRENLIGAHVELLMRYLALYAPDIHCIALRIKSGYEAPSILMKKHLRKAIGEIHWRRFIDFDRLSREEKLFSDKVVIAQSAAHVAAPPPFPTLSPLFDKDVTLVVFSFLDGKSMYEASKVSRSFRDALIPRQRNVTFSGFSSLESFREFNFLGMEYFSGGRSSLLTKEVLDVLVDNPALYPNLARVNTEGCYSLSVIVHDAEREFKNRMGPRLDRMKGRDVQF